MQILQSSTFKRAYKKLQYNQRQVVNQAIRAIAESPDIGVRKKGDLADLQVHKFKCVSQQYLLAYHAESDRPTLINLGPHENFHRDLKR